MIIEALGFDPEDMPTLFNEDALPVTKWGTIKTNFKTMMTSLDGVFAAGDIVRGASLVVWGIRDGRDAAESIESFIEMKINKSHIELRRHHECKWLELYKKNRKSLEDNHLYDQSQEHDACGVGFYCIY